ncbi:hypothetical protein K505DRAFT_90839 [Melanomma pulvis-pyrius CBS 109.77]|uniref:Uncharacterized protein n=1 Tax=Melanomma pulvis-pyrius CBS 109.77 TaxID=1314802 RepID=A0A6A6X0I2_9PLEO|nr:hypothetical protein K505DRAFT_90839 [Melanomma pulvis-pyrius CBS 109.77]
MDRKKRRNRGLSLRDGVSEDPPRPGHGLYTREPQTRTCTHGGPAGGPAPIMAIGELYETGIGLVNRQIELPDARTRCVKLQVGGLTRRSRRWALVRKHMAAGQMRSPEWSKAQRGRAGVRPRTQDRHSGNGSACLRIFPAIPVRLYSKNTRPWDEGGGGWAARAWPRALIGRRGLQNKIWGVEGALGRQGRDAASAAVCAV